MGKCEQELKAIRAERDHWKRIAQERGQAIQNLTNRLERAEMYADAFTSGAMPKLDERIERLQTERDNALKEVAELKALIYHATNAAIQMFEKYENDNQVILEELAERQNKNENPDVSSVILEMLFIADQTYKRDVRQLVEKIDDDTAYLDTFKPQEALYVAGVYRIMFGMQLAYRTLMIAAYAYSHDTAAVADKILRECRTRGEPTLKTVNLLPTAWMQKAIGCKSHITLKDALTYVTLYRKSGLKKDDFAYQYGIASRALDNYLAWYRRLDAHSKSRASFINWQLQEEFDED